MAQTRITKHAVEMFMQRTGATDFSRARQTLENLLLKARPVQLKRQYRLHKAFKHANPANYFRYSDWIFVVSVEDDTMITCYMCGDERWEPKPRKVPSWAKQL